MAKFTSEFLNESLARGFIHQGTHLEALDEHMAKGLIIAYLGFDATAKSLHVGNLVQVMWLRLLQRTGHKPLVLVGGGTTRAGDPSGKDAMRKLLSPDEINQNIQSIQKVYSKYLKFGSGSQEAVLVNNADWLLNLNYLDFLRDYGRHFSVNRMLTFDSVRLRLEREQPLSFLEFNYMVLQAYDFLELHRRSQCILQLGGADQWGNIVSGVDLVRRVTHQEVFGLTSPLITTSDGKKMGKTEQGAVWLEEELLSSFDYWQFWRNTQDADVGRFLKLFTDLPLAEIERLEKLQGAEINEAKIILADEATRLCHGETAVAEARKSASQLFSKSSTDLETLIASLPTLTVTSLELQEGLLAVDVFKKLGLVQSNGDAKRLIQGGGAKINDQTVSDQWHKISSKDLTSDKIIKLSAGKKHHAVIVVKD
jgi:tyrosyl-tRNA synthetase